MAADQITWPDKTTGDTFSGAEATEVKDVVNNHASLIDALEVKIEGLQAKQPVDVATTANITLSGTQTIDGVSVTAGMRVLVKNQSAGAENGIYVCAAGAWSRSADMNAAAEFPSAYIPVNQGTVNADSQWKCTNDVVVVGTTAIVIVTVSVSGVELTSNKATNFSVINHTKYPTTQAIADLLNSSGVVYTSENGCVSDAVLTYGSTTFGTDNTAALQVLLNRALTGPIKIIINGRYSCSQLTIYGNTTIECLAGCGLILRSGSNTPLIRNGNYAITEGSCVDNNITFIGGIYNGNGGNQTHSNVNGWNSGIRLFGVKNLVMENVRMINTKTFAVHLMSVFDFSIRNMDVLNDATAANNNDGVHVNGPSARGIINGVNATTKDDKVALNADDLGAGSGDSPYSIFAPTACVGGIISEMVVSNVNCRAGSSVVRILSGAHKLQNIIVDGITGVTANSGCIIDNYTEHPEYLASPGAGLVENLVISNCSFEMTAGGYKNAYFYINIPINNLKFENITRESYITSLYTFFFDVNFRSTNIIIDKFYSLNTSTGTALHDIVFKGNADVLSINNATFNRAGVLGSVSSTVPPIVFQGTFTSVLGKLSLFNIVAPSYDTLVSTTTYTISSIFVDTVKVLSLKSGAYTITTDMPYSGYIAATNYYGQQLINSVNAVVYNNGNYSNPLSRGAYYNFEQAGLVLDQGAYNNNLTLLNAPSQTTGKVGNCYNFVRASSQSMRVVSNSSITGFYELGIAGWFYLNSLASPQFIVSKYSNAGGAGTIEFTAYINSNRLQVGISTDGSTMNPTPTSSFPVMTTGAWYFLVANYYRGVLYVDLFSDTALIGSVTWAVGSSTTPIFSTTQPLVFGATSNGTNFLDGKLDEFIVRKQAFTLEEKNALWNGGAGITYSNVNPLSVIVSGTTASISQNGASYVFTGAVASAFTLVPINGIPADWSVEIKNRGSANITLATSGTDSLYDSAVVSSITITPGQSKQIRSDGIYFDVLN
jgi:hypothetical protein